MKLSSLPDAPPKTTSAFGSPDLIAGYAKWSRRAYCAAVPAHEPHRFGSFHTSHASTRPRQRSAAQWAI